MSFSLPNVSLNIFSYELRVFLSIPASQSLLYWLCFLHNNNATSFPGLLAFLISARCEGNTSWERGCYNYYLLLLLFYFAVIYQIYKISLHFRIHKLVSINKFICKQRYDTLITKKFGRKNNSDKRVSENLTVRNFRRPKFFTSEIQSSFTERMKIMYISP